jgi:hypothetical protein
MMDAFGCIRKRRLKISVLLLFILQTARCVPQQLLAPPPVLNAENYRPLFADFVQQEREMLGHAPALPWDWFVKNIPLLDVPDHELEEIYYFRWYAFQKHIKKTPDGYVISEFLDDVPWAGKFNTINAAAGHQIREARWLRESAYVDQYAKFWFGPNGKPRRYSLWAADSVYQLYLATGDRAFAENLLPALEKNYQGWESSHQDENGLYWQIDDRDGMEYSISGTGYRPTINSYMYGDAIAIAQIAEMAGQLKASALYHAKADKLKELIEGRLWNSQDDFYETVPRHAQGGWIGGRELIGYIPWYFNIPTASHDGAWKYLFAPDGFDGKYGPPTAERRNPRFDYPVKHECLWNGPSWPFATTQTLVALANLLNGPKQKVIGDSDYLRLISTYTHSQHLKLPDGKVIPWIDEDLNADTGEWIARDILISQHALPRNRGRYYNHSGFADLVITGLIGLRPAAGNEFSIHPLVSSKDWSYFALDKLPYHGHLLTILYDRDGSRYNRGAGLQVLCDGRTVAHSDKLQTLQIKLPNT